MQIKKHIFFLKFIKTSKTFLNNYLLNIYNMNNIYHFHSRKELYGKNVNIYRKEKSNKEYFKYSNVMYDVKNYKKIKLTKSNINFKRGGGESRKEREAREYGEALNARSVNHRRQLIEESSEQRKEREDKVKRFVRRVNRRTKVDEDSEKKEYRTRRRAYLRTIRPKEVLGESQDTEELNKENRTRRRAYIRAILHKEVL